MSNHLETAKRNWPTTVVGGTGRWAVVPNVIHPYSKIMLFEDRLLAEEHIIDRKAHKVVDLMTVRPIEETLAKMRDPYDPEDRRRARQERQSNA